MVCSKAIAPRCRFVTICVVFSLRESATDAFQWSLTLVKSIRTYGWRKGAQVLGKVAVVGGLELFGPGLCEKWACFLGRSMLDGMRPVPTILAPYF